MNREQVIKILRLVVIATLVMFLFEVLFSIPGVTDGISNWVEGIEHKWALWAALWFIMFIQVSFIPIPAYIVLNAAMYAHIIDPSNGIISMFSTWDCWIFIIICLSASMVGSITAYGMGRRWGKKAIKWCAGSDEEYDKWSKVLNERGKWWYASTVLFPVFPDDLLCLVAGSVKFDFHFFFWSNVIGKSIGLICMIGTLALMQSANEGGIPWTLIGWGIALIALFVLERILTHKHKKDKEVKKGE